MRGLLSTTMSVAVAAGALTATASMAGATGAGASAPSTDTATTGISTQARAAATHETGLAARRHDRSAYRAVVVAPQRLPDGSRWNGTTRTTALGISNGGAVLGSAWGEDSRLGSFVGGDSRARWLSTSAPDTLGAARATAISPTGRVVGSFPGPVQYTAAWDGRGRVSKVDSGLTGSYGISPSAVNSAGAMAGCENVIKVGTFVFWNAGRSAQRAPHLLDSNCAIGGISETGLAVGTANQPHFRTFRTYPAAVAFTATSSYLLKVPNADTPASAAAISPNGRYIVGRAGGTPDALGPAAFLSKDRNPSYLRGAAGLDPKVVTDRGVVAGVRDGRAQLWRDGRLTDLTTTTAGLPRGWVVTDVAGINASGDIAATAADPATKSTYAVKLAVH